MNNLEWARVGPDADSSAVFSAFDALAEDPEHRLLAPEYDYWNMAIRIEDVVLYADTPQALEKWLSSRLEETRKHIAEHEERLDSGEQWRVVTRHPDNSAQVVPVPDNDPAEAAWAWRRAVDDHQETVRVELIRLEADSDIETVLASSGPQQDEPLPAAAVMLTLIEAVAGDGDGDGDNTETTLACIPAMRTLIDTYYAREIGEYLLAHQHDLTATIRRTAHDRIAAVVEPATVAEAWGCPDGHSTPPRHTKHARAQAEPGPVTTGRTTDRARKHQQHTVAPAQTSVAPYFMSVSSRLANHARHPFIRKTGRR